jgi:DNA-binding CsgD family transcriptional regulator
MEAARRPSLPPLSPRAKALLHDADRRLMALAGGGSRYPLYALLRATASAFARTDSFYVGFTRGDGTVVYPYNYDGREYDDPNVNTCAPGGLTEWIVNHGQPYWSRSDGGALLHRGRPFGDTSRRSREAVAVPLLESGLNGRRRRAQRVIGIVSLLSYEDDVYTTETVRFLQCLADSLTAALRREREDEERRRRFGAATENGADEPTLSTAVNEVNRRMGNIRRQAEALRARLTSNVSSPLLAAADALCRECEQGQTETAELLLRAATTAENPLLLLSAREQEVAALMTRGCTNRQIGEHLFISELTAKTHCASVIRKLRAGGRSGVAEKVRPFLMVMPPTTPME